MLHNDVIDDSLLSREKTWSIIGAGPVGSMQALIFATLFPGQIIHVLDRYRKNVRGHGLEIHKKTIEEMVHYLLNIKNTTKKMLAEQQVTDQERRYYQTVIHHIDRTMDYLKKNLTTWHGDAFIRTTKICEMLQKFTTELSHGKVLFHLSHEVQEQHLEKLINSGIQVVEEEKNAIPNSEETREILENSSDIIGADGAHSRVRKVVFNETNEELDKEVLSYLLEIKLEMKGQASSLDKLTKSVLPSITKGDIHIWNRSRDNTATLHLFIDKKTFEALRSQNGDGRAMGEFTNPYRRLSELPEQLQKPIEQSIVDVIGIDNFDANTVKITTIPMHVFKAKQLVKRVNGKTFVQVGDSAIGLALANGVNNGFCSTVEYGMAYYYRRLHRHKKPEQRFEKFQLFRDEQYKKFDSFLRHIRQQQSSLDMTPHVLAIRNQYEEIFNEIVVHPGVNAQQHSKKLALLARQFVSVLGNIFNADSRRTNFFRSQIQILCADLQDRNIVLSNRLSELHLGEIRIKERANKKITEIKQATRIIDLYQSTVGKLLSPYIQSMRKPSMESNAARYVNEVSLRQALQRLQEALPKQAYRENNPYAQFVFDLDRLYLGLREKAIRLEAKPHKESERQLHILIAETTRYMGFVMQREQRSIAVELQATAQYESLYADSKLDSSLNKLFQRVTKSAKTINRFSSDNITTIVDNLIMASLQGTNAYLAREGKHLSVISSIFDNNRGKNRAGFYQKILQDQSMHQSVKLAIIFAILTSRDGKTLQRDVTDSLSETKIVVSVENAKNEVAKLIAMSFPASKINALSQTLQDIIKKINCEQLPQVEVARLQQLVVSEPSLLFCV